MNHAAPMSCRATDAANAALLAPLVERLLALGTRDPYFDLDGYMRRLWIQRPIQHGGSTADAIRIHEIISSDSDRHMHDHPWDCRSIVLRGGYWEVVPASPGQPCERDPVDCVWHWRGPGTVVTRKAGDRHYLILPPGASCLSWFEMGPKICDWGYHVPGAPNDWVLSSDYERYVAEHRPGIPARRPPPIDATSEGRSAGDLAELVAMLGQESPQFMKTARRLMPELTMEPAQ